MNQARSEALEPWIVRALDDLTERIRMRYPDAEFDIELGIDDPNAIHLIVTVDIEEPEDVVDLVIDRVLEIQVEERLPIHVIALRPLKRIIATNHLAISHPGAVVGDAPQSQPSHSHRRKEV